MPMALPHCHIGPDAFIIHNRHLPLRLPACPLSSSSKWGSLAGFAGAVACARAPPWALRRHRCAARRKSPRASSRHVAAARAAPQSPRRPARRPRFPSTRAARAPQRAAGPPSWRGHPGRGGLRSVLAPVGLLPANTAPQLRQPRPRVLLPRLEARQPRRLRRPLQLWPRKQRRLPQMPMRRQLRPPRRGCSL